jgi:hypothetical protein
MAEGLAAVSRVETSRVDRIARAAQDIPPLLAFQVILSNASTATPAAAEQNGSPPESGLARPSGRAGQTTLAASVANRASRNGAIDATPQAVFSSTTATNAASIKEPRPASNKLVSTKSVSPLPGSSTPAADGRRPGQSAGDRTSQKAIEPIGPCPLQPLSPPPDDRAITDPLDLALEPARELSAALAAGTSNDIRQALAATLERFADGSVPTVIKNALAVTGGAARSAEIDALLDSISVIASNLLANGPFEKVDFSNSYDELFWVSNWLDLFGSSETFPPGVDVALSLEYSVNSAMVLPLDVLYTRAALVPLTDMERVISPGMADRQLVRKTAERPPGEVPARS